VSTEFPDNPRMQTSAFQIWWIRAAAFLVAAMASASAAWWALTLSNTVTWQPSVSALPAPQMDVAALAQALGAGAAPVSAASASASAPPLAIQLLGVVAGSGGKGHALLLVGDAAPKTYKVGSKLGDGLVLQSVGPRSAQVGAEMKGPTRQTLELPPIGKP
jgi:general secretion pathway protein C